MKKLTVIVKPANREDVIDIMESCAVYGVMETDITGYGNQKGYRVTETRLEAGAGRGACLDRSRVCQTRKNAPMLHGSGCLGRPGAAAAPLARGRELRL